MEIAQLDWLEIRGSNLTLNKLSMSLLGMCAYQVQYGNEFFSKVCEAHLIAGSAPVAINSEIIFL